MTFKIYSSSFGVKIAGVNYDFTDVVELQIEDPEKNNLTRGANAKNSTGLAFREGAREPKRWTLPIIGMSAELKVRLDLAYENQERLECYCIDDADGSSKMLQKAIIAAKPQQLSITEDADSMNVSLEFIGFVSKETHKS